jgi:serine/threonine-protein kinase
MSTTPTRDRWQYLEPLLDQLLDLEPELRAPWLAELAVGAPVLAAELRGFLAEEQQADRSGFLAGLPDTSLTGQVLGAYRLDYPLGQGGMGTVWLARRIDGRFEGTAAVKLPHLALLSPQGQERFRQEGSVLARLAHPGIARLLDAGVSAAGQPYLILEYVDGRPIDRYVRDENLNQSQRIRLFLQVLAAVGHAHANLIVHRDLKPSNILVDAHGSVKLLDFGIAKLLAPDSGVAPMALTVEGARVFTPEHAAPEQVRGEPLTTAADVYALGVLLYMLLSGRHPTSEKARSPAQFMSTLLEVEPSPLDLGDLDNILAKSLRKRPEERYQTVGALAEDLERFLQEKPVSARPQSPGYRLERFVHRNRLAVATAALMMATLVGATVFSVAQMRDARRQRDSALRSAEQAQALSELQAVLAGDQRGANGQPMSMAERLTVAERVLTRRFAGEPWLVSEVLSDLSGRFFEIGDLAAQRAMLTRALVMARQAHLARQIALAACLRANSFAFDDLIDSARIDLAEARPALAEANREPLPDPRLEALCLKAEGQTLIAAGASDSGIASLTRAVELTEHDVTGLRFEMLFNLAGGLRLSGRTREAIPYFRQILAEFDSLGYGDADQLPNLANSLAVSLAEVGEFAAVDSELRPFIREQEAVHGAGQAPAVLAFAYGWNKLRLGDLDSADRWIAQAIRDSSGRAGINRWLPGVLTDLRLKQGRLAEARRTGAGLGGGPRGFRSIMAMIKSQVRYAEGDRDRASRALEATLDTVVPGGPLLNSFALPLVTAGYWRLANGDAPAADSMARLAHAAAVVGDSLGAERSALAGRADLLQARALIAKGDPSGAVAAAARAVTALGNGYGPDNLWTHEARALRDSLPQ